MKLEIKKSHVENFLGIYIILLIIFSIIISLSILAREKSTSATETVANTTQENRFILANTSADSGSLDMSSFRSSIEKLNVNLGDSIRNVTAEINGESSSVKGLSDSALARSDAGITTTKNLAVSTSCSGDWMYVPSLAYRMPLLTTKLDAWTLGAAPSFVEETLNNPNIVAIGHNYCSNGNCNLAGSDWGKILEATVGQTGELCKDGEYFSGSVIYSDAVSEFAVYVMGNWLEHDTLTAFASYGQCKDAGCSATDQRWVIAFERKTI